MPDYDTIIELMPINAREDPGLKLEDKYDALYTALKKEDVTRFQAILEQAGGNQMLLTNHVYRKDYELTLLELACINGQHEFVKILLRYKANPNRINPGRWTALHMATEHTHYKVLKAILNDPKTDVTLSINGKTALHVAVEKDYLEGAKLLLDHGACPNEGSNMKNSPLHVALRRNSFNTRMVELIVGNPRFIWDAEHDTHELVKRIFEMSERSQIRYPTCSKCLIYNKRNDLFLQRFNDIEEQDLRREEYGLLASAVENDFWEGADRLLQKMNVQQYDLSYVIRMALKNDNPDMYRIFVSRNLITGEMLCDKCAELGLSDSERTQTRIKCIKLILTEGNIKVRCVDGKGNTPLHYAARANCEEIMKLLLEKGSYILSKNKYNVPPMVDIPVGILSDHFDKCIVVTDERNYGIELDYTSFTDSNHSQLDTLEFIANNNRLKHLLTHPLLSSFVYLKGREMRHILRINVIFYTIFFVLTNLYIYMSCVSNSGKANDTVVHSNTSDSDVTMSITVLKHIKNTLHGGTIVFLILLFLRESVQVLSSRWQYFCSRKNWLDVPLIILVGCIVCVNPNPWLYTAVTLLSTFEFYLLIRQYPKFSTNIEMFRMVTRNFAWFLFVYCFIILAFALCFFILFRKFENGDNDFASFELSLFTTFIMIGGEYVDDIPFKFDPTLSRIIFMLFVFLIVIVLFNLLNGLAVRDIDDITNEAKLIGLISKIHSVAYTDRILHRILMGKHCSKWKFFENIVKRLHGLPSSLSSGKISLVPDNERESNFVDIKWKIGEEVIDMDRDIIEKIYAMYKQKNVISDNEKILNALDHMHRIFHDFMQKIDSNNLGESFRQSADY